MALNPHELLVELLFEVGRVRGACFETGTQCGHAGHTDGQAAPFELVSRAAQTVLVGRVQCPRDGLELVGDELEKDPHDTLTAVDRGIEHARARVVRRSRDGR